MVMFITHCDDTAGLVFSYQTGKAVSGKTGWHLKASYVYSQWGEGGSVLQIMGKADQTSLSLNYDLLYLQRAVRFH